MSDVAAAGADEATPAAVPAEATAVSETPQETPETTGAAPAWLEGVSDDKVVKLASRYTSPATMAEALYEANREISQRVKMPGEDASEEDLDRFRKAMGVPDSVDDYTVARPEHIDEEAFAGEEYQAPIRALVSDMHAAGASKAVVEALFDKYFALERDGLAEQSRRDAEHKAAAETELRKEWGAGYDENLAFANDFMGRDGKLLNLELKDGSLLASYAPFVKLMAEAGRMTNEGQLQLGLVGTDAGQDLQQQYDSLSDQFYEAYNRGESDQAKRLDAQRQAVGAKLFGTASV